MDARAAAERVDLEAGIVRDGGKPASAAAWRALISAFATKLVAVLDGRLDAELGLRHDLEPVVREDRAHLARAFRHCRSRARRGVTVHAPVSALPRLALQAEELRDAAGREVSIASSSSRRKAWPSAVPCTSMKAPPEFITTFMSVSASTSSA